MHETTIRWSRKASKVRMDATGKRLLPASAPRHGATISGSTTLPGNKRNKMHKYKHGGFADILVVVLAGAIILASGLVLEGIRTVTEDELPDGWSYDQTIMEEQ